MIHNIIFLFANFFEEKLIVYIFITFNKYNNI